jgi:ADP-heptose:LPS heptosyltransferase
MKKVIFVNGGAGRVISSLPALEELDRRGELAGVICEGGMEAFLGHPTLQDKAFDVNQKGIFEDLIKDNICVSPEPYRDHEYYNQRSSLQQSFWYEIVGERTDKNVRPNIVLSKHEEMAALNIITQVKQQHQKEKTIVIQPFGRSSQMGAGVVYDGSSRSLEQSAFIEIVGELSKEYNVIYMGEHKLNVVNVPLFQPPDQVPFRVWAAIIEEADYFIGCDSVGQHIAYAYNKPGTVILGSTFAINVSFPEHFNIIEKKGAVKRYSPIRIAGFASEEADRLNDTLMDFSKEELKAMIENIKKHIEKTTK